MTDQPKWPRIAPTLVVSNDGPLTEDSLARDFVSANCNRLRWDNTSGIWFVYDKCSGIWRPDSTGAIVWEDVRRFLVTRDDPKSPKLGKKGTISAIEALSRVDIAVATTSEFWDRHLFLLATPGAHIDLKTGTRQAPASEAMVTQTTIAAVEDGEPQRFLAFLYEACGSNPDYVAFIQRMFGYALTGCTKEHAMFFLHGPQGSGKSTLVGVIQEIFGSYSGTAPMSTFLAKRDDGHPTGIAMLRGKRLIASNETKDGTVWDEALLKNLTGGDRIAARLMHKDFFEFKPTHKFVMSSNYAPAIRTDGEGLRRRFHILPFLHQPRVPDKDLHGKLIMEAGQILGWMIRGCLQWQQRGLDPPAIVREATQNYFDRQDVFGDWLETCCVQGSNCRSTSEKIYTSYTGYMTHNREAVLSSKSFGAELTRRNFGRINMRRGPQVVKGWQGLQLADAILSIGG